MIRLPEQLSACHLYPLQGTLAPIQETLAPIQETLAPIQETLVSVNAQNFSINHAHGNNVCGLGEQFRQNLGKVS